MILTSLLVVLTTLAPGYLTSPAGESKTRQQYGGIITAPGLKDSVTVYRDERGMPHIYASNEHDLYFTVGYISAQERLWQMDLIRRSTEGRLSEIFGKSFLPVDIVSRGLKMPEKSVRIIQNMDPEILACMEAYAGGINLFITTCKKLPVEFRILSYSPEPWSLEDIVNIIGLMGWSLGSRNLTAELFNYQLVRKVGAEKAASLIPGWDIASEIVYPGFSLDDSLISRARSLISSFDRVKSLSVPSFSGSNNWAVSGDRSETGKPLLSNDMHLPLNNPSIWIQMHQVVPGKLNVTGVVIPGEPFVVAGHNEKIAWGMTNLMVDDVDLFTERINPENPGQYFFNGEWKDMTSNREIIRIKGGKQDTVNYRFTHRGPVISGLLDEDHISPKIKWMGYDYLMGVKELDDISLSLKWSGYDLSNEVKGIYLLNRADGWDDFRSGLKEFGSISQNFVYSDTEGNIGLNVGGHIPLRKGDGIMIRNGETDEFDWKGYVPFEKLPFSFNPAAGYVSSANNKTADDYPYYISQDFVVPYRIRRIREMLDEKEVFGMEDFRRMISDQQSVLARLLTPYILKLNGRTEDFSPSEKRALADLSEWKYEMNPSLNAPSVFEFFRICLRKNLLADELGDLYDHLYYMTSEYYIYKILTDGEDEWTDNILTPVKETLDDIVMKSFREGVSLLVKEHGRNPDRWNWGRIHTVAFIHPLGTVKILDRLYRLNSDRFPVGGSDHTVNPFFSLKPGFRAAQGASVRNIYNAADWDDSYSVLPGGISGVPKSEFYLSQVKTYLDGKFYRDYFTRDAVINSAKYKLVFKP